MVGHVYAKSSIIMRYHSLRKLPTIYSLQVVGSLSEYYFFARSINRTDKEFNAVFIRILVKPTTYQLVIYQSNI